MNERVADLHERLGTSTDGELVLALMAERIRLLDVVQAAGPALELLAAEGYGADPPNCAEYENLRAALAAFQEESQDETV